MEMKPAAEPATGFPVDAAPAGAWSSGLFDCFDDCGLCTCGLHLILHSSSIDRVLMIAMNTSLVQAA